MMSGSQEPLLTPQWKVKQLQEQKQQEQNKDKKERINPIRLGDGGSLVTDLTIPSLPRTQSSFPQSAIDKRPEYGFNKAKKSQSMPTQTSWPPLPSLASAKAPASSAPQSAWLTPKIIAEAKATNPSSPISPSNSSDDADKITSMSKADRLRLIPKLPSKKPSGSVKGHTPISLAQTKPPPKRNDHEERNERGMVVLGQPMFITKPKRSVSDLASSASALDMSIEGNNPSPPKLDPVQTTQGAQTPQPSSDLTASPLELQAESERTEPRSEEALSGDEKRNTSSSEPQGAQKREVEAASDTPIVEVPNKETTSSSEKSPCSDGHNVELEEDDKNFMKELGWDPESSNGVLTDEEINQFIVQTPISQLVQMRKYREKLSFILTSGIDNWVQSRIDEQSTHNATNNSK